jgi:hypothetical protein
MIHKSRQACMQRNISPMFLCIQYKFHLNRLLIYYHKKKNNMKENSLFPKISPQLSCTPLQTAGSTLKSVRRQLPVEIFKNFTNIEKGILHAA